MFNDKKLRNTIQIAVFTVIVPCLLLFIGNGLQSEVLVLAAVILGVLGLFISIALLSRFIKNWKVWSPPAVKIIGLIMAILGIIQGLYAVLMLLYILSFPGPAMIGLNSIGISRLT